MKDKNIINTAYPGRIMAFDVVTQLASVEISRELFYSDFDGLYQEYDNPLLIDVPVHFPQCGGYSLTFPIKVGDSCLIIYSQKGHSHWLYEDKNKIGKFGNGQPKAEYFRSHNINDALCIVGFNPVPKAIPNFSATNMELRNDSREQRITFIDNGVIDVYSNELVQITAPVTRIVGNVIITGNLLVEKDIEATGEVTGKGIHLSTHTHGGVTPGSGNTGVPK